MAEDSTFGDDTPGIYIRGIDAIGYVDRIWRVTSFGYDVEVVVALLRELAELLDECRAR